MKKLHLLAAVAVLLVSCAVSFYLGRQSRIKDYEAACILSDICRMQMDYHDEYGGFEELYWETLDNLDCREYHIHVTGEEIAHDYYWCY